MTMPNLVTKDGLVRNNQFTGVALGGYLPDGAASSEGIALMLRGVARSYAATLDPQKLEYAKFLMNAMNVYFAKNHKVEDSTIDSPWYTTWLVNSSGPFAVRGPVDNDHLDGGGYIGNNYLNSNVTFVSGVGTLYPVPDIVYQVATNGSEFVWQNVFSEIVTGTGTNIEVEYYVTSEFWVDYETGLTTSSNVKVYGTQKGGSFGQPRTPATNNTFDYKGKIVLKDKSINGVYLVNYSVKVDGLNGNPTVDPLNPASQPIEYGDPYEAWPMWRHMGENEFAIAGDALHWITDAFYILKEADPFSVVTPTATAENPDPTPVPLWQTAYDRSIEVWKECCNQDSNSTHIFLSGSKGEYNNFPLTYSYSYGRTNLDDPTTSWNYLSAESSDLNIDAEYTAKRTIAGWIQFETKNRNAVIGTGANIRYGLSFENSPLFLNILAGSSIQLALYTDPSSVSTNVLCSLEIIDNSNISHIAVSLATAGAGKTPTTFKNIAMSSFLGFPTTAEDTLAVGIDYGDWSADVIVVPSDQYVIPTYSAVTFPGRHVALVGDSITYMNTSWFNPTGTVGSFDYGEEVDITTAGEYFGNSGGSTSNLGIKLDVPAGYFAKGVTYTIVSRGTANTDFTLLGAANNNVGTTFVATGSGTPVVDTNNGPIMGYASSLGPQFNPNKFGINGYYNITSLGTTDWNFCAGTTGVTYAVGDTFLCKAIPAYSDTAGWAERCGYYEFFGHGTGGWFTYTNQFLGQRLELEPSREDRMTAETIIHTTETTEYPISRYKNGNNFGIAGSRVLSWELAQQDVLNNSVFETMPMYNARRYIDEYNIVCMLGGTNDIASGTAALAIFKKLRDYVYEFAAEGKWVFLLTVMPRTRDGFGGALYPSAGGSFSDQDTKRDRILELNRMLCQWFDPEGTSFLGVPNGRYDDGVSWTPDTFIIGNSYKIKTVGTTTNWALLGVVGTPEIGSTFTVTTALETPGDGTASALGPATRSPNVWLTDVYGDLLGTANNYDPAGHLSASEAAGDTYLTAATIGNYKAGQDGVVFLYDGLHPAPGGAITMGRKLANTMIAAGVPSTSAIYPTGSNLIGNPSMTWSNSSNGSVNGYAGTTAFPQGLGAKVGNGYTYGNVPDYWFFYRSSNAQNLQSFSNFNQYTWTALSSKYPAMLDYMNDSTWADGNVTMNTIMVDPVTMVVSTALNAVSALQITVNMPQGTNRNQAFLLKTFIPKVQLGPWNSYYYNSPTASAAGTAAYALWFSTSGEGETPGSAISAADKATANAWAASLTVTPPAPGADAYAQYQIYLAAKAELVNTYYVPGDELFATADVKYSGMKNLYTWRMAVEFLSVNSTALGVGETSTAGAPLSTYSNHMLFWPPTNITKISMPPSPDGVLTMRTPAVKAPLQASNEDRYYVQLVFAFAFDPTRSADGGKGTIIIKNPGIYKATTPVTYPTPTPSDITFDNTIVTIPSVSI